MTNKVQTLEWKESATPGVHEAETALGIYRLRDLPLGCAVSFHENGRGFCNVSDRKGVTLEEGKQIAQQDFESRMATAVSDRWDRLMYQT
jgi:hypothetical protein